MIVKNESAIIRSTLENLTSYVKFAYWVICDTGSTDGTQDIIKTFFKEKNIPGDLFEDEWKDFGHNRSLALKRAYESKKADYVLIFDADDAFRGNFKIPTLDKDRYSCKFGYGSDFTWYRPVILNNRIKWKYFGVLHEYVDCIEPNYNPTTIHVDGDYYIEARTIGGDRNKDDKKYQKDALLLEKALETETDTGLRARYAFYCAQSFRDCGDLPNSIKYYMMRTKMGFFDEEIHVSYYNSGKMMATLNYPEQEVEKTFLDGWNFMKDRSECLYELSKYFRLKGNYIKGYTYGLLGRKISFPKNRVLFLHRDVYDWRIHDETAISAYYIGRHDEAIKYNQVVLQHHYDERVLNNIRFSMKEILNKIIHSPNRTINVSKHRPLCLTFVLRFHQNIDLVKLTMNSLFHFIRDAYKLERFILLIEANKTKEIEQIKKDYPFFEIITAYYFKNVSLKSFKYSFSEIDIMIFRFF
jgi:glycosyltransferase involved in cell wall biosynthesis